MKLQLVFDEKPRRGGGNGASGRIAKVLYQQGIDVSTNVFVPYVPIDKFDRFTDLNTDITQNDQFTSEI